MHRKRARHTEVRTPKLSRFRWMKTRGESWKRHQWSVQAAKSTLRYTVSKKRRCLVVQYSLGRLQRWASRPSTTWTSLQRQLPSKARKVCLRIPRMLVGMTSSSERSATLPMKSTRLVKAPRGAMRRPARPRTDRMSTIFRRMRIRMSWWTQTNRSSYREWTLTEIDWISREREEWYRKWWTQKWVKTLICRCGRGAKMQLSVDWASNSNHTRNSQLCQMASRSIQKMTIPTMIHLPIRT